MLDKEIFKPLRPVYLAEDEDGNVQDRRRIPRDAYAKQLPENDVLLYYRSIERAGRYLYSLTVEGRTYSYSKAHFWAGGNGRCYIGQGPGGEWVAIKEMRRSHYPYMDSKKDSKPRKLTDRAIGQEYETCSRLGMSLRPIDAACTLTKAYMVLPLAHQSALSLATMLLLMGEPEGGVREPRPSASDCEGFLYALLRDGCAHLAKIHQAGLVHNDVKMNNIVFCANGSGDNGHFELLDYGMSYSYQDGEAPGCNIYWVRLNFNDSIS